MSIDLDKMLYVAIQAALKAGEAIMEVYDSADFGIEIKEDASPLTKADKNANMVINGFLEPTNIPIISEENKEIPYEIRKQWDECWIVDPVDGTKEFIKRNGEFTVNIALVKNNIPVLGVIYVPVSKTLYWANVTTQTAHKAIVNKYEITREALIALAKPLQPIKETTTIAVVGSRSHMSNETLQYVAQLKAEGKEVTIVSKGSSLKFCLVAEGEANVYPRFAPTMEWDTAAGQAICSAVGVSVISEETKATLQYNKENLLNPWFICKS